MTSILITGIGGDIAQAAASIVREAYPSWRVHGVDMDTRHGGSLYVDQLDIAPAASSDGFLDWLSDYVFRHDITYCLPMSEAELAVLAKNSEGRIGKAQLLWAGKRAIEIGCDKLNTADFIRSIGISVPWTLPATADVVPPAFPCIFKLRCSAGSKAVFVCNTIEEIHFYRERYPEAVIQEYLPDGKQEITCAVYRTRSGRTEVMQMLRRLVGGFTGWAEVVDENEVTEQCVKIAEALNLFGAINIQLRITESGPRIFEINPRFSSTVLMRHLAGYTDVFWMLEEAVGRDVLPPPIITGTELVRTQGAAFVRCGKN
jgi:carbamoyl-phosphate synthase large subunit